MGEEDNLTGAEILDCRDWLLSIADDYAKDILPLYRLLEWKWWDGVPDEIGIVATLRQLAYALETNSRWITSASTGGLTAWVEKRGGSVSCGFRFSYEANRYGVGPNAKTAYKKKAKEPEAPESPRRSIVL